jgi:hypothetical protein
VSTKFTYFFARRNSLLAVFFLIFGTSLFAMPTAQAAYANTTIICSNGTNERSFQVSWDNSNQFFANKGYIPRLYCEGGYAGSYRIYISDTLNDITLGYFQGLIPVVSEPTPVAPSDTSTVTSETQTATVDTSTSTSDTSTSSSDTTTTTSQQETPTVTPQPSDSSTVPSDTSTVETVTVAPVDGSTATVEPAPQPVPMPNPQPVVEPTPEPEPVTQPEAEPTPEPTPEPETPVEEELPELVEEPVDPVEETPEPPEIVEEEESITLENGVVLTVEVAQALELFNNPSELLEAIFTDPGMALEAFANIGADMSPEVREKSEDVIVAAVIVGNIATQAAATAGAAAAIRRKP